MPRRFAPRGWSRRAADSDPITGSYQAVCGHYVPGGTYACQDCNLAPLSEWLALRETVATLVNEIKHYAPDSDSRSLTRALDKAQALLESLD